MLKTFVLKREAFFDSSGRDSALTQKSIRSSAATIDFLHDLNRHNFNRLFVSKSSAGNNQDVRERGCFPLRSDGLSFIGNANL
jgi:hypothetical protein